MKTKELTLTGIMTAVICILGPLTIITPLSPVPISLTNFAIYLSVYILGTRKGCASCMLYLFLGLSGLPVFSGFSSGPGILLGPTGGYLIGFLFMALVSGWVIEKWPFQKLIIFLGLILGMIICYSFGSLWLALQSNLTFLSAFTAGVLPFIPGDVVKIWFVTILGSRLQNQLQKAGLLQ